MNARGTVTGLGILLLIITLALTAVFSAHAQEMEVLPDWINSSPRAESLTDFDELSFSNYTRGNMPRENVTGYVWDVHSSWFMYDVKRTLVNPATIGQNGHFYDRYVLPFGERQWQILDLTGFPKPTINYNSGTNGVSILTFAYQNYNNGVPKFMYSKDVFSTFGRLAYDTPSNISSKKNIIRKKTKEMDFTLKHDDGSPVTDVTPSGMTFSKNGKWMYVPSRNTGKMRFNTDNFSILSFAKATNPGVQVFTAISNSGRFFAEFDSWGNLTVYDLDKCESEKPNLASRNCQKKVLTTDFKEQIRANLPDPSKFDRLQPYEIRFKDESTLEGLINVHYDGKWSVKQFIYRAGFRVQPIKYLALGDSFSSGQGAYRYRPETDFYKNQSNYNLCHQSTNSYPYVLQASLSFDDFGSVACSGAKMANVVSENASDYIQAYGLNMGEGSNRDYVRRLSIPGYINQSDHLRYKPVSVATISIGGNDIGFQDIVTACIINKYLRDDCYHLREDRERLANLIDRKIAYLSGTFKTIKENLSGGQKLYVVGYPLITDISTNSTCDVNVPMNLTERGFAVDLINYLNAAIRTAASNAGVFYVDVSHAFNVGGKNYQLCGDQNILAVNGLLVVHKSAQQGFITSMIANTESFHPNTLGHLLLASAIRNKTNDLSAAMPEPNETKVYEVADNFRQNLVGDTRVTLIEKSAYESNLAPKTLYIMNPANNSIAYNMNKAGLPSKNGEIKLTLHSDPVDLGTLVIDQNGVARATFNIPSSVPVGYHELHLTYTDMADDIVDIFQNVFVGYSVNDIDGDGIKNENDECIIGDGVCLSNSSIEEGVARGVEHQIKEGLSVGVINEEDARKILEGVPVKTNTQFRSDNTKNMDNLRTTKDEVRRSEPESTNNIEKNKNSIKSETSNPYENNNLFLSIVASGVLLTVALVIFFRRKI